ncbi:hypothetical protein BJV74DRAFT_147471 [Russula compacta]|nr:hypothetical protein BJV74DRAFT_147471 [Russula compacta]
MASVTPSELYALEMDVYVLRIMHVCAGIFIWEFLTTLDFEWEVYTGKRPWRWSFIVYVVARVLALLCFVLSLVGFNLTQEFNCNAWLRSVLSTAWLAACSASFLLVLRGVAIWGRDPRIVLLTGSFWLANLAGSLYATTKGRTHWVAEMHFCLISHTDEFRWSIMINFIEDFVLLVVMFFGVLHKRNATHLWNLLYFQGLFWILAATMTELPSVVCLPYSPPLRCILRFDSLCFVTQALGFKNINDGWNMLFQYPHCMSKPFLRWLS